jgi:hypothetical protein
MSDNGFILLLSFGAVLLVGILAVVHLSAHRLQKRLQLRRQGEVVAPEMGNVIMPELVDPRDLPGAGGVTAANVQIRHAEPAR